MGRSDFTTSLSLLGRLQADPHDQQSWNEFVERYGGMIEAWCHRWGLQEADAKDITQNVLLALAGQMRDFEYRHTGRFRSWLKTIAHRAWCDYLDRRKRLGVGSGSDAVMQLLQNLEAREEFLRKMEEECDRNLMDDAMQIVRGRVQSHTWLAFVATALEGKSPADTAQQLNIKVGTVYVARSKVQKMLREEVQRLNGE